MSHEKPERFYGRILTALKKAGFEAKITESFEETDEADAGASFSSGHNVQISPYASDIYSLYRDHGDTFVMLYATSSQKAMIEFIKKNIRRDTNG